VVDQALWEEPEVQSTDLRALANAPDLPIVAIASDAVRTLATSELERQVDAVVWPDTAQLEELVDVASLFLHTKMGELDAHHQEALNGTGLVRELRGKRILVVDDDVRNIFAMTSALEKHGATVFCAENGLAGLTLLDEHDDIDAVMVDIMMPGMDGYEVMRRIRRDERFQSLPVVAVTAKAMSADRDKCIAAGATDYMAKPVDIGRLLTLLKIRLLP
jgi:CheY-like chemotaxis protein